MSNIQFFEQEHLYKVDDYSVPSVTTIVSSILGSKYDGVPPAVLAKKAQYGNEIHEWIENYCLTGKRKYSFLTPTQQLTAKSTLELFKNLGIKAKGFRSEELVAYDTLWAGKFDLLREVSENTYDLIDIKTTAVFDEKYLQWQLGFYKYAIEQTLQVKIRDCYCLWCPKKHIAEMIKVEPVDKFSCVEQATMYRLM